MAIKPTKKAAIKEGASKSGALRISMKSNGSALSFGVPDTGYIRR
jgi:hypothetical protein